MSFSTIPARANGTRIQNSWFDSLKAAGVLVEAFLGAGFKGETSINCANNQVSAADLTGLVFAAASYKSALIQMEIRRKTDSSELIALGHVHAIYRNSTSQWELIDGGSLPGDETGVTLSITAAGQVKYVSDSLSGANYVGTIKFKATTFSA